MSFLLAIYRTWISNFHKVVSSLFKGVENKISVKAKHEFDFIGVQVKYDIDLMLIKMRQDLIGTKLK
jgi:hypothetical protein